ncbi:amino acid permease 3 [Perilla frutescens var. hirtella]|nr:amino acid permease 3 [Perilla frutescens var. frutescens]KAH6786830.1 amino acid permease 3 [Perilla frutescens var. hirtella]
MDEINKNVQDNIESLIIIDDFKMTIRTVIWWLSVLDAVMTFIYPTICLGLEIAKFAENGEITGSLIGVRVGIVTETQKIWTSFQAFGAIAFSYSCTLNLIDIQILGCKLLALETKFLDEKMGVSR